LHSWKPRNATVKETIWNDRGWVVAKERGILIRRHLESDAGGLCVVCMIYDEARINEIVPISVY